MLTLRRRADGPERPRPGRGGAGPDGEAGPRQLIAGGTRSGKASMAIVAKWTVRRLRAVFGSTNTRPAPPPPPECLPDNEPASVEVPARLLQPTQGLAPGLPETDLLPPTAHLSWRFPAAGCC